ncbi:hypothetical protein OB919_13300 [Halobacteria archaeon AArc-curdl1]|uniref:Isoprenylcysteine carboxylmethyltransferase family protein n=1 Tax=Natronosalvus hydrolyticus TaxID=2979988 RepID=A0AAP2Z912_9EURY|nr:hypothetical protein [Halobacteria archaeon AArc-curdl1]
MIVLVAFAVGLVTAGIFLIGVVITISDAGPRLWPHGERDWTYWVHYLGWGVHVPAFVLTVFLDAGSFFTPGPLAVGVGLFLIATGLVVAVAAIAQLGLATSTGIPGELYTNGLYRYSRNPQTVGLVTAIAGAFIATGSMYVLILGGLDALVLLLAAIAEESWLEDQYGNSYEVYRDQTPRFIGLLIQNG